MSRLDHESTWRRRVRKGDVDTWTPRARDFRGGLSMACRFSRGARVGTAAANLPGFHLDPTAARSSTPAQCTVLYSRPDRRTPQLSRSIWSRSDHTHNSKAFPEGR